MNIKPGSMTPAEPAPSEEAARAALEVLRRLRRADPALAARLEAESGAAAPARVYDEGFRPDAPYLAAMPDLQNGPESLIRGARRPIQHVGISNFRLPLLWPLRDGGTATLETSVVGSVALEATRKGINMSRIMRSFYRLAQGPMDFEALGRILDAYLHDLDSDEARLMLRLRLPLRRKALRSGLEGWQYYDLAFELAQAGGRRLRAMHLDYVYSSTCPCSLELAEHARAARGRMATPHSQRSLARVSAALAEGAERLWPEDLIDMCARAIPTETQVMVKREDEQAFAELNGANPIFVEDAARLLCAALEADPRIGDFRVAASHQESLHSHDAVSVLVSGPTFAQASIDPRFFETLRA
ncbi:GTP cyclohydrolase FolE2 [Oceanicella actignis]|uniref:GTP cyclohydrolase FolE2 n=1 Tax=Oceanicella actignis TaxID=1189325 RepID=A0A1M7TN97_9RHOB|nr:GTP cyclohydrolase FolE2 [Oceanicella actignis]TYO85196.1 GTP cyclohydrolase I [Oceanicella actignis]SET72334.1 GTP cyclohydrolase I [Oceanicella actignis]SHN72212.1 GTP cyclohydrolase I [Oceanicella actignis]